ncbi:hypothetical protein HK101_010430 [Irineochytrium annulatum]|nr:hypothetical protein HK101_010430 [Irineochytrium annulatum]
MNSARALNSSGGIYVAFSVGRGWRWMLEEGSGGHGVPEPASVAAVITKLTVEPDEALPALADELADWSLPKSDFFHWIPVLNRFDAIMESVVDTHEMKVFQKKPMEPKTKELLLAVLKISKVLWENCTSRGLYSSYEHLSHLLHTSDLDVLDAVLRLMIPPSQRNRQRTMRTVFAPALESVLTLAQGFGSREIGMDLTSIAASVAPAKSVNAAPPKDAPGNHRKEEEKEVAMEEDGQVRPEWFTVVHQFYRLSKEKGAFSTTSPTMPDIGASTSQEGKDASQSASATPKATPAKTSKSTAFSTPSTSVVPPEGTTPVAATDRAQEGLTVIHIPNVRKLGDSASAVCGQVLEEYDVPSEHQFTIFHKLRIAFGLEHKKVREQLCVIRILAISVAVMIASEEQVLSKLFLYEPDLTQKLADLLQSEENAPMSIQIAALYAIDGIVRQRLHVSEVWTALNASANHGTLIHLVKKAIAGIDQDEEHSISQEFLDVLFVLISLIISSPSGGSMVITAGIIPTMSLALNNTRPHQLKNITKFVSALDSIMYAFAASFASFSTVNGLDLLVSRTKAEVNASIEIYNSMNEQMDTGDSPITKGVADVVCETNVLRKELPYDRVTFLRSLLKFIMHMMQTAGTIEGMRNLIDSSLPETVRTIFNHFKIFGANIFGLAVNIMSCFVHNEPTCLSILQEAKLPNAFYDVACSQDLPISAEVISALPNAFGALCLNQAGLDAFNAAKPMENFLRTLTIEEHIRPLQDKDVPHLIGTSVDELVRHHPSLKDDILAAIIKMLERVVQIGQVLYDDEAELRSLWISKAGEDMDTKPEGEKEKSDGKDRKEARVSQFIDIMSRFLQGLFQNASHCKDIVKLGGVQILLKLYTLPSIPYNFATSTNSYTLSYLFRLLADADPYEVVTMITTEVLAAFETAKAFLENDSDESYFVKYIDLKDTDEALVASGQKVFRSLTTLHCFVRLISDMYSTHALSHSKSVTALIATFIGRAANSPNATILQTLALIHRVCNFENLLLKTAVPKTWYESAVKKAAKPTTIVDAMSRSTSVNGIDVELVDLSAGADGEADAVSAPDAGGTEGGESFSPGVTDYRVKNTGLFKYFLTGIPSALTPTMQGITRQLTSRRISSLQMVQCFQILDAVGASSKSHFTWERALRQNDLQLRKGYLSFCLTHLSAMILDDRNNKCLQTAFVASFDKAGGFDVVLKLARDCWLELSEIPAEGGDEIQKEMLTDALEHITGIFATVVNAKILTASPITGIIQSKEKDRDQPNFWDAKDFLISLRLRVLTVLREFWMSEYFKRAKETVVSNSLAGIIQILKAEGEQASLVAAGSSVPSGLAATLIRPVAPPPVVPDEDKVQQLVEMGFPRAAAESALIRYSNNVSRAAEYLITHPTASFVTRPSVTSATAAVPPVALAAADANQDAATLPAAGGSSSAAPVVPPQGAAGESSAEPTDPMAEDDVDEAVLLQRALEMSVAADTIASSSAPVEPTLEITAGTSSTAPISEPAGAAPVADEKSKGKEVEAVAPGPKDLLHTLREEVKAGAIDRSLEVLSSGNSEMIFDVKELMCLVAKDDVKKVITPLLASLQQAFDAYKTGGVLDARKEAEKSVAVRLRLFALLVNDNSLQVKAIMEADTTLGTLIDDVCREEGMRLEKDQLPAWVSSALILLEFYVSLADEPRKTKLRSFTADDTNSPTDEEKGDLTEPPVIVISMEKKLGLIRKMMQLMKEGKADTDTFNAVLRLTMRLTRTYDIAVEFEKSGGVQLLFVLDRVGSFSGQQTMTMLILRHLVEDAKVLKSAMAREITAWLNFPRTRTVDVHTFVKNNAHIACRDPVVFEETTIELCRLSRYDPSSRQQQISLKSKVEEQDVNIITEGLKDPEAVATEAAMTGLISSEPESGTTDVVLEALSFMVNELLSLKNARDPAEDPSKASTPNSAAIHFRRGYLLTCLAELVQSFPGCKFDVIQLSMKKAGKAAGAQKSHRNPLFHHLLNDLLPTDMNLNQPTLDLEGRKKSAESMWASSFLVGLCIGPISENEEKKGNDKQLASDTINSRRIVLDAVSRAIKDAINSTESADIRYSRFFALSSLIYKLLTVRSIPGRNGVDESLAAIAKIMLEKSFVTLLTSILVEVDVHHPVATQLTTTILKPLEFLTKLAIKLGRMPESSPTTAAAGKDTTSNPTPVAVLTTTEAGETAMQVIEEFEIQNLVEEAGRREDEQEQTEISDIYRNSSLGMFNARDSEEERDDEDDDEEGDDEEDEDEFGEFDEDEMSGDEEDEDQV